MREFINYCTDEQTMRALKLGAPIESGVASGLEERPFIYREPDEDILENGGVWNNSSCWFLPTTNQMIKWLLDKHGVFVQVILSEGDIVCCVENYPGDENRDIKLEKCLDYKDAEYKGIDAALDYLEKKGDK